MEINLVTGFSHKQIPNTLHKLADLGDVVGIDSGTGLVVLGGDEERHMFTCEIVSLSPRTDDLTVGDFVCGEGKYSADVVAKS